MHSEDAKTRNDNKSVEDDEGNGNKTQERAAVENGSAEAAEMGGGSAESVRMESGNERGPRIDRLFTRRGREIRRPQRLDL